MILPVSVLPVHKQKPRRAAGSRQKRLVRNIEVKSRLQIREICLVYGPQSGGIEPGPRMRRLMYIPDFVVFHEHVFFVCQN